LGGDWAAGGARNRPPNDRRSAAGDERTDRSRKGRVTDQRVGGDGGPGCGEDLDRDGNYKQ